MNCYRTILLLLCFAAVLPAQGAELIPTQYHGYREIEDVDQEGALVAIAMGYGLELLESGPAGFTRLSHLDFNSTVSQVVIHGSVLYAGVHTRGLYAIDISDPASPVVTGLAPTSGSWKDLEVSGDVAVAHTTGWGWNVFIGDLSDPLHPVAADSLALSDSQSGFALGDEHFYYVSSTDDLETWSIADPYNAYRTDQYTVGNPRWTRLTVSDGLLWAHGLNLTAFSLADPANPAPLSTVAEDYLLFPLETAYGHHLYRSLSSDTSDLVVYDYAVPTAPVAVDTLDGVIETTLSRSLFAEAGELLLVQGTRLSRYDLSDPSSPTHDADLRVPEVLDLAGESSRVWSAGGLAGFACLDLTDPAGAAWLGPWAQAGAVTRIAVDGDRLATVEPDSVRVFDISDPALPAQLFAIGASAVDVDIENGVLAYTAEESAWIAAAIPGATPAEVFLGGEVGRIELENGHAFAANTTDMVTNIDVNDPGAPFRVGAVPLPGVDFPFIWLMDLTADGDLLVVSAFEDPDCVIDIADPAAPAYLAAVPVDLHWSVNRQTRTVALSGRWLILGNHTGSVHLIDLVDPLNPLDVTGPTHEAYELSTWAADGTPVTGGWPGAVVYEMDVAGLSNAPWPAARALELGVAPNPANPRVNIFWEMPRDGRLQVDVYDLAGRRIAALLDENRGSGAGTVAWNGTDSRGRAMSSGVYLVRVRADELVETRTVTLVR